MYKKSLILTIMTLNLINASPLNSTKEQVQKVVNKASTVIQVQPVSNSTLQKKSKLTIAEATLKAINSARAKNQTCAKATSALRWNPALYQKTKEHSIDMAVTNKLSHIGSGTQTDITAINLELKRGSHFYERVNQKKDSKKILSAELIIRTEQSSLKSPRDLINYWITKPNDCKVIMDSRFTDVALSKVISNKDNKAYWTLMLIGNQKTKK